mmetsp:Transcript_20195/g.47184  ORF Transcript_20195/g.47184 Transcript_20195/m.47184 type:complete len:394 (-) Transcript_20195:55-1236(-)
MEGIKRRTRELRRAHVFFSGTFIGVLFSIIWLRALKRRRRPRPNIEHYSTVEDQINDALGRIAAIALCDPGEAERLARVAKQRLSAIERVWIRAESLSPFCAASNAPCLGAGVVEGDDDDNFFEASEGFDHDACDGSVNQTEESPLGLFCHVHPGLYELRPIFQKFMEHASATSSGWKLLRTTKDVMVFQHQVPGERSSTFVKGIGTLDSPVTEVLDLAWDLDRRPEWDQFSGGGKVVRRMGPDCVLVHCLTATPPNMRGSWLTSRAVWPRDMCLKVGKRPLPGGGWAIVATSVVDDAVPECKGMVRAIAHVSGCLLLPYKGATLVVFLAHVDPNGWIPPAVVEAVACAAPLGIIGLRKVLTGSKEATTRLEPKSAEETLIQAVQSVAADLEL